MILAKSEAEMATEKKKSKFSKIPLYPKRKGYVEGKNRYKVKAVRGLDLEALERAKRDWL